MLSVWIRVNLWPVNESHRFTRIHTDSGNLAADFGLDG
jgi:hypothetical protein